MATITRVFEFDAAHRVMNEKMKCFNLHGHRFSVEVTFGYSKKAAIGYALDFKEIKRICGDFIDEFLDHSCILNPMDRELIALCKYSQWKVWVMGLGNTGDINPSAENIASELFYVLKQLFIDDNSQVQLVNIRLFETPNCWVEVQDFDYTGTDQLLKGIKDWRKNKGTMKYDVREK